MQFLLLCGQEAFGGHEGEDVGGIGKGLVAVYAVVLYEQVGGVFGLKGFAFEFFPKHGGRGVERYYLAVAV